MSVTVVTLLYQPPGDAPAWAACYTPAWVDKLYRGVQRHYRGAFNFVCLADDFYEFEEPIDIQPLDLVAWMHVAKQCYCVKGDRLVVMGLDTIIVGDLSELFAYNGALAAPRDPYNPSQPCNGVVLCPPRPDIAVCSGTDMDVLSKFHPDFIDDLFPGQVRSYKVHVRAEGLGNARIVYFHGWPKPNMISDPWVAEHWR